MAHIGCKHLDYEGEYTNCKIVTIEPQGWKYWERGPMWTEGPENEGNPKKVQFCKKRGRINGIAPCILPGGMGCYEAQEEKKEKKILDEIAEIILLLERLAKYFASLEGIKKVGIINDPETVGELRERTNQEAGMDSNN